MRNWLFLVLYWTSVRCASSHCVEEAGLRKPSQRKARQKCLYAYLRTYTQSTKLFAAEASLRPTPTPLCEVA